MNEFLCGTKKVFENIINDPSHYDHLRVVLGNEACDLDSAICSLVYGFVLYHEGIEDNLSKTAVLPLLNIAQDELEIKTEVVYFLRENGIVLDFVQTRGYRNILELKKIHGVGALQLTLVDGHTLPFVDIDLKPAVVEIIDHRQQHPDWMWEGLKHLSIEPVGSCCTLIAQKIIQNNPHLLTKEIAKLLLGPIVLDTVNLSPDAGRATPLDIEIVQELEKIVSGPVDRKQLLKDLVNAKSDVKNLTTSQILNKDLKIISGIPVAGVPLLLENISKRSDFHSALLNFLKDMDCAICAVLMGVQIEDENVRRDLAVFSLNSDIAKQLLEPLFSIEVGLQLEETQGHGVPNFRLFSQGNQKATRKLIGPIIAKTAATMPDLVS